MKTIVVRNNTNQEQIWLRTFLANEEYEIPSDNSLPFKYSNLESLITAIASGDASIGNGDIFYTTVNEQINYLKGVDASPKDNDGASVTRPKAAKAGWTYHLTGPEFVTSTINSLYHKDLAGNDLNESMVKFYDANNAELQTQQDCDSSCVKTVFSFEPTWDYEIIGGTIKTFNDIVEDVRVWVIAVPDISAAHGGSKIMAQSLNLKFIDPNNGIEADGRVSKYMAYSATLHTNKIQLIIKHPVGFKEPVTMILEVFRS